MAQFSGTVRWFNNAKGYGFLGREQGTDVFCHFSSIQHEGYKSLKEGDRVEFDIIQDEQGVQAGQVRKVAGDAPSGSKEAKQLLPCSLPVAG